MDFDKVMPGEKPFNQSITLISDELIFDKRISAKAKVLMMAILLARQHFETKEVDFHAVKRQLEMSNFMFNNALDELKTFQYVD